MSRPSKPELDFDAIRAALRQVPPPVRQPKNLIGKLQLLREEIGKLHADGHTEAEIAALLKQHGISTSVSSLRAALPEVFKRKTKRAGKKSAVAEPSTAGA